MKLSPSFSVRNIARTVSVLFSIVAATALSAATIAQTQSSPFPQATELQQGPPLTNDEFVRRLYQLQANPGENQKLIDDVRKRGISFPITPGLRSLIATKSGNDVSLLHTLEEANRRRTNPTVATPLPPLTETNELLAQARKATLGAAETMPDYLVKQQIRRSHAFGQSKNWVPYDNLTIAVSYRQSAGEDYKLLSINGMPVTEDQDYNMKLGGTISTGEYVSALTSIFRPESQTDFEAVDTDTLHDRRTVIYEYTVKRENSRQTLGWGEGGSMKAETVSGYKGRIWVDRENYRVLRLEAISTEIEPGFPITAASKIIDYDWATINEVQHLLPSRAVVELTAHDRGQTEQTRNEILFRGYRKFGAEVKIIDISEKDFPADKPDQNPAKPEDSAKPLNVSRPDDSSQPVDLSKPPPVPILKPKKP